MSNGKRVLRWCAALLGVSCIWACAFDISLREYLSAAFWLPFAKHASSFERPHVRRMDAAFAGMTASQGETALDRLRAAYQAIADAQQAAVDVDKMSGLVGAARADPSLTPKEKEEVELIDRKVEMRAAELEEGDRGLLEARKKLSAFVKAARWQEYRSEARGWLAHIDYLLGDQTAAGKIYLDELNRNGSNLSRETLLNSLRMNYGYDGGQELLDHLGEYFDTPEHAAFAIQLVTNPSWPRDERNRVWGDENGRFQRDRMPENYPRIRALLENHRDLLRRNTGELALLGMRTALRMGDPSGARDIGNAVAVDAAVRGEPDFKWMLASARFLSQDYAAAEEPLLALFQAQRASIDQKAAAAYGLCGVYRMTGNIGEQIRFALWLHTTQEAGAMWTNAPAGLADLSVYWASSGWDLGMLLDAEAPIDALAAFADHNPGLAGIELVQYSLAVRLARENRYREAADVYQSIFAVERAGRMRELARWYDAANETGASMQQAAEAKYAMAEFLSSNPDRIYFNAQLWRGFQRYAFQASSDNRLTRAEREQLIDVERKLKDEQEERWRAYLIVRDLVSGPADRAMKRKAALLGIRCLEGISERFGRAAEIRAGIAELVRQIRR